MNERILIIEDDQAILKMLQRGLAYEGYTVDTATDGRMGLIAARDHTPDLVVLDWMLPGMDGLEVCHRLRQGGSIPILMLTAKDTVQDRIQGLDAGADDYMVKPFNLDELLARVRACRVRRCQARRPGVSDGHGAVAGSWWELVVWRFAIDVDGWRGPSVAPAARRARPGRTCAIPWPAAPAASA